MLAQIAEVQRMSENAGSNPAEVERVYNQQLANAQQMAAGRCQDGGTRGRRHARPEHTSDSRQYPETNGTKRWKQLAA